MKKIITLQMISLALLSQTACVPVAIVGGAGAIGYTAAQDRTLGETVDDAAIEAQINAKFVAQPDRAKYKKITEDSVEGRVLLTGTVPDRETKINAYKLVWEIAAVKEVINELKVDANTKFSARQMASDAWISTQIESRLLFAKDVKSINYSVETIDGVVYLMGIAQSRDELDTVTQIVSEVRGVEKVKSYVKIKGISYKSSTTTTTVTNENRDTVSDSEEIQTVPGSIKTAPAESVSPPPGNGSLIIEESPNAQ